MFFLALAVGVAVGAADDESEWRSKDEKKSVPVRSLADDWDDDSAPAKRATKSIKPSLRQITTKQDDDFDKPDPKPEEWHAPDSKTKSKSKLSPKPLSIKPGAEVRTDEKVVKTKAVADSDDGALPLLGGGTPVTKPAMVQIPTDAKEDPKPSTTSGLPELPKGLSTNQPPKKAPKVLEIGPNETQTKDPDEALPKLVSKKTSQDPDESLPKIAPKKSVLPELPKQIPDSKTNDAPPTPKPMSTTPVDKPLPKPIDMPIEKQVKKPIDPLVSKPAEKKVDLPLSKTTEPPIIRSAPSTPPAPKPMSQTATQNAIPIIPSDMQAVPKTAPATTTKVDLNPAPKVVIDTPPPTIIQPPGTTVASPPVLMEHGVVDESANVCMPLMDAASAWRFETRTFLMWWDQPGTHAFVRDAATEAGILGGPDYNFEKQFAQELSLERRFDAATALVISGFMTEDARQGVGAVAFNGLDLGVDGPGSGVLRNLSGFSGRATSRLWKVDVDFVQHYLQEPDSPIRGRFFIGPQFIGIKETYGFTAQGATGDAVYDARTVNTLFGGDIGGGITFQPWYSNLGIDVSGRYGAFGNVFDIRNDFSTPGGAFVGHGDDRTSRFATAGELNVEATLRIARNICLMAGWRLWHIQGIGRAVAQVPSSTASTTLSTAGNGNLFAHGLFLGATLGWGGAADPNSRYGGNRPYILREP